MHLRLADAEEQEDLEELRLLAASAGAEIVGIVEGARQQPDSATYVGSGKAEEVRALVASTGAELIVVNAALSPGQERNLEKVVSARVLDRTGLILDIFAQRAHSHEGKLQVQLAQLEHLSTRLVRGWTHLERQKGGIGLRGPGETQLESDRRMIGERIRVLHKRLDKVRRQRLMRRRARLRSVVPTVSLVGYTNAGKSTLLNRLTDAGVLVEDRLFATLDPRTRRLQLPGGEALLVSDTVGFVRKLPHQLVESFRSTLEVVEESDLLVHLVDSASPEPEVEIEAVRAVLADIGAGGVPELMAFNKSDLTVEAARLAQRHPGGLVLSARTGEGVDGLLRAVGDRLRATLEVIELCVPYEHGEVLAAVHREGEVLVETHGDDAARLRVRVDRAGAARFAAFRVGAGNP